MRFLQVFVVFQILAIFFIFGIFVFRAVYTYGILNGKKPTTSIANFPSFMVSPTPLIIPREYIIPKRLHEFQTFNNCGPVTLSMVLSYWGIEKSQEELGKKLRPYQVAGGDNDDKSVTLEEVGKEAERLGLYAYVRPNGTSEKLKQFIAQGIPVVTRTWLEKESDIGHYRLIRGYTKNTFIQDDSLQGANIELLESDFLSLWRPFNFEYLIVFEKEKKESVDAILGEEKDESIAWKNALRTTEESLSEDPANIHYTFALSRIYYHLGKYHKSVELFDRVEKKLSFRTLWYQIEPIHSLYEIGDYNRLFTLTESILENQNRAYSELYFLRGKAYQQRGDNENAKKEFEKAVYYNKENQEYKQSSLL